MFQYFSVRDDDDLIRNSQNPLLMGNDQNGTFNIASHLLKYLDQILETPEINSRFRLVKNRKFRSSGKDRGNLNSLDFSSGKTCVHFTVYIISGAESYFG